MTDQKHTKELEKINDNRSLSPMQAYLSAYNLCDVVIKDLAAVTKQRDELRDELTKMQTFMTMLNKPEKEFLAWTETLDEHPQEYDGVCYCDLCKSYAD